MTIQHTFRNRQATRREMRLGILKSSLRKLGEASFSSRAMHRGNVLASRVQEMSSGGAKVG